MLSPFESVLWTCAYSESNQKEVFKDDVTSAWSSWDDRSWSLHYVVIKPRPHEEDTCHCSGLQHQMRSQPTDSISHQTCRWMLLHMIPAPSFSVFPVETSAIAGQKQIIPLVLCLKRMEERTSWLKRCGG